ncbi:MAG: hypothetical protein GXP48_02005 [Acidobacteria bacterium]|nr:hypothetical protein [Acidobacteriota bacterium]
MKGATPSLADVLVRILERVPAVRSAVPERSRGPEGHRLDTLRVAYTNGNEALWLVLTHPRPLKPREAELMALELEQRVSEHHGDYAVVVAPYVSPRSAKILARSGVGFADESGNCRMVSGTLYIERRGLPNARVPEARLRSLFTPGAERVLRALLDPGLQGRRWTIRKLAGAAFPGVSVGQAHKVVQLLEERAFLRREENGLVVVDQQKLLEEWSANYRFGRNRATRYYSPLSQRQLYERFLDVANHDPEGGIGGALASFSAGEVLAPAVRQHRFFLYWTGYREPLVERLNLKRVDSGDNVVVYEPYDEGVLYRPRQVDAPVTCPVQTYLDLRASAARGEEAAQAVYDKWLKEAYTR